MSEPTPAPQGRRKLPRPHEITPEQRQVVEEEVRQAAIEGRTPFDYLPQTARGGRPLIQPEVEGVFTAAHLTGVAMKQCERVEIPGTGLHLWVFPISPGDRKNMLRWTLERLRIDPDNPRPVSQVEYAEALKIYQVVLCCRQQPTKASKRCFTEADFHGLEQYLGSATVDKIVTVSNRLSGEDEALSAGVRAFFGRTLTCLQMWHSASGAWEACPDGLRETTEKLASLVSRALSRGKLESGIRSELDEL